MQYIGDEITAIREKYQQQIDSGRDLEKFSPTFVAWLSQLDSEQAEICYLPIEVVKSL